MQLTIPGRVDWSVVRRVADELGGSGGRLVWGVDGCKSGWFYLAMAKDGRYIHGIARHLEDVVETARSRSKDMVLVDIPIGLSDGPCERVCDREARKLLKKGSRNRSNSVFRVPARSVIEAGDISHARASDINHRRMRNPRGKPVALSLQTYSILPKIREVEVILRLKDASDLVREVHPELCFAALSGGKSSFEPMEHAKRSGKGQKERRALIERVLGCDFDTYGGYEKKSVSADDILDAAVAAITGWSNDLKKLPGEIAAEDRSRPEMVYAHHVQFGKTS